MSFPRAELKSPRDEWFDLFPCFEITGALIGPHPSHLLINIAHALDGYLRALTAVMGTLPISARSSRLPSLMGRAI